MNQRTAPSNACRWALCVFLLGISAALPLYAAEAEDRQADTAQSEPADQQPRAESRGSGENQGAEVFIPTEEISEDFAVSFPVDI